MQLSNCFEQLDFENGKRINTSRIINRAFSDAVHWHPFIELLVCLSGHSEVTINFSKYTLYMNDLMVIYPGDLHTVHCPTEDACLVIQFPAELVGVMKELNVLSPILSQYPHIKYDPFDLDSDIRVRLLKEIVMIGEGNDPFKEVEMYSLLLTFFRHLGQYCMKNRLDNQSVSFGSEYNSTKLMAEGCLYISENCTQQITLEGVARYLGISRSHFSHLFKHYTRMTFVEFLTSERIKHAETLFMSPSMRITDIAFASGFSSISSFNRAFKKMKGISPSGFRTTMQHIG